MPSLKDIYNDILENNVYKIKNLDKLFDLGISHKSISLYLIGNTENLINKSFIEFFNESFYEIEETPIYSFSENHVYRYGMKYFTYFSALQEYWRSFQFGSE